MGEPPGLLPCGATVRCSWQSFGPSLAVVGVEPQFTAGRRKLVAHDEPPEPRKAGRSLRVQHLYIVDMDCMRPGSFSFDDPLKFDPAIQRLQE